MNGKSKKYHINGFRTRIVEGVAQVFGEMDEWKLSGKDGDGIYQLAGEKYQSWDWKTGIHRNLLSVYRFAGTPIK